jgi:hypothetical protein
LSIDYRKKKEEILSTKKKKKMRQCYENANKKEIMEDLG